MPEFVPDEILQPNSREQELNLDLEFEKNCFKQLKKSLSGARI